MHLVMSLEDERTSFNCDHVHDVIIYNAEIHIYSSTVILTAISQNLITVIWELGMESKVLHLVLNWVSLEDSLLICTGTASLAYLYCSSES